MDSAGDVTDVSEDQWHHILNVNLTGAYIMCRSVWPVFVQQRRGVIVNNSSIMGLRGDLASVAYCSSKAALLGLTKSLAADGAASDIRVNCVCPGFVDTPAMARRVDKDPNVKNRFDKYIPLRRMAEPIEIANVILFLASSDSSYLTGSTIVADGGASLGYCGSDLATQLDSFN
jgi:meso-butanediol dehydrogenase / (S,S)-butanediol dehydrogenase / diacetyl reductase